MTVGDLKRYLAQFPDNAEVRTPSDLYNRDCISMKYVGWDGRVGAMTLYVEVRK